MRHRFSALERTWRTLPPAATLVHLLPSPPVHDDRLCRELFHCGQYGIDGSGLPPQNPPMSKATWFWHKADECGRKAKDATNADRRDRYETQAKVWRQLAEQVEANDKNVFGSDPK
jgi:hypothetical protein